MFDKALGRLTDDRERFYGEFAEIVDKAIQTGSAFCPSSDPPDPRDANALRQVAYRRCEKLRIRVRRDPESGRLGYHVSRVS